MRMWFPLGSTVANSRMPHGFVSTAVAFRPALKNLRKPRIDDAKGASCLGPIDALTVTRYAAISRRRRRVLSG